MSHVNFFTRQVAPDREGNAFCPVPLLDKARLEVIIVLIVKNRRLL